MRCQASEGPGKEFTTIFEKDDFGADDLPFVRFHVTSGNKLGYGVDARLVDLRVRYGTPGAAKAVELVPRKGWLALTLFGGLAVMLLAAMACGLFLYLRRDARSLSASQPAGGE